MRHSSWLKADIFRRIPKDLTEATMTGAIISIACVTVMLILFTGEVISYVFPRTNSDMVVDYDTVGGERLKVFLDLDMLYMPCALVSVDIADMLKNHQVDSSDNLRKIPLDADGREITGRPDPTAFVNKKEGCRLKGFIYVTKVPGNFHISSHSRMQVVRQHFPEGFRLDHVIRKLAFEPVDSSSPGWFRDAASRPLEGTAQKGGALQSYNYFLNVVPTLHAGSFYTSRTYQYTHALKSQGVPPGQVGMVLFSYQLSPIAVQYSSGRVSFTHFLTYVCAIIGGVYTVAGLVSRFVYNGTYQFQKRFMGKGD